MTEHTSLDMPLEEAMRTQRAIRRLRKDPVDHDVLLRCIELALRAPTGSNAQGWEFVVVEDRSAIRAIGRLNAAAWRLYGGIGRMQYRRDETMQRILAAVQHQVDNYDDIPALVVPCVRSPLPVPFVVGPVIGASSLYGSVYPSIQNFLLACRAVGLGACLTTLPLWNLRRVRRILDLPRRIMPVAVIPVGWPQGRYGPTTRKPVGEVVHLDRYGNRAFLRGT